MNRRDILKPPSKTKAKQKLEVVTEPEIEEDKVFKHSVPPRGETKTPVAAVPVDAVPVETPFEAPVETPFESPKKTRRPKQMTEEGKKRMLEASARGRKTAAENRSRRAKERKLEKEKVLEEHGGEKGLKEFQRYQQLKEKYDRRLPSVEEVDEVEDIEETPTPLGSSASAVPVRSEPSHSVPPLQTKSDARGETPYKNVGSAQLPNSAQNVIDYERLITGISERFERQFLTDKQVRQKQHEVDRAEVDTYKDKFTSLQRKQTMDTLSNNRVFQRTHSIKDQFRGRAARGWYRR